MRISDWSSDVCSSDLIFHQKGEQLPHAGVIRAVADHPALALRCREACPLEICQVMRHRGGGNAATLRNLARHQPIGSRLHEHAENRQPCFVPKGLQGIDGPDLIDLWHANPRLRWTFMKRSEEHPSELQS